MGLFDYDYDELARQIQTGLERLGVSFLRGHGARVHRDDMDFHGHEQIDLELTHDGHTLKVRQVGPPRGPGTSPLEAPPGALEEVFESTFDGWPSDNVPTEQLTRWLATLPAGEAPREKARPAKDPTNPFVAEQSAAEKFSGDQPHEPAANPFLVEQPKRPSANPFADPDRERRRQDVLRQLKGDDDDAS